MPEKKDDEKQPARSADRDADEKAPKPGVDDDLNANDIKLSDEPNNTVNARRG